MKRLVRSLFLLVAFSSGCAHRAPPSAAVVEAAAPLSATPPHQAMWTVQGPKGRVVLLGSMHALREPARFRKEATDALARAQRVVFESDFTQPAALQQQVMTRGTFSGGLSLSRVLSPATLASLDGVLRDHGMTARHLEQFEPWLVGFVVSAAQVAAAGAKPEHGVEQLLFKQAKAAGKTIAWMEDAALVLASLDALSLSDQETYLNATLKDSHTAPAQFEALARAWHTGDLKALDLMLNDLREQAPALHERLLTARNQGWVPGLEAYLNTEGETLVVVGAAHLVGQGSVVELLQARGYQVQSL